MSGTGTVWHWILPISVLFIRPFGLIVQVVRGAMMTALSSAYVKTARAKGVSEPRLVRAHITRNVLVLVLTTMGLQIGSLMGQAIVIEKLFSWPGIGSLLVDSVSVRDIPVVQGAVLVIVLFWVTSGAPAVYGQVLFSAHMVAHMTLTMISPLFLVLGAPITLALRSLPGPEAEKTARVAELIALVGLRGFEAALPQQLSGGMSQRAAIARALCMEPKALLFDEPTSALDPELEQEVIRVIKALADEGRTMIIVTHDMRMAADVSDHVVFLHQGRIEEEGSPDMLFGAPRSERLRQFLRAGGE